MVRIFRYLGCLGDEIIFTNQQEVYGRKSAIWLVVWLDIWLVEFQRFKLLVNDHISNDVGIAIINHQFLMVYTTHLW